jgi:hypothetical protein
MAESSATTKSRRTGRVKSIARLFGNAHVFPSDEKWATQKGLFYRTFGTQAEAIKYALRIAKGSDTSKRGKTSNRSDTGKRGSARVVLHEKSGKITKIR